MVFDKNDKNDPPTPMRICTWTLCNVKEFPPFTMISNGKSDMKWKQAKAAYEAQKLDYDTKKSRLMWIWDPEKKFALFCSLLCSPLFSLDHETF